MCSLFKKNKLFILFCTVLGILVTSSYAAEAVTPPSAATETLMPATDKTIPKITEPYIDYYPVYPPTRKTTEDEEALIRQGEYLARMGDCISCHTNMKAKKESYAGGLPIPSPFGTFYSPNITPDKETGIGNWTEEDFIRAMKEGRSPHGYNYFPAFPYVYFSKISDDDARAMYAYFMSIPPIKHENKSHSFPLNIPGARTALWGWNLLFFYPDNSSIAYEKDKTPLWNRGKYIVDSLGHCDMCHTPMNMLGATKKRYYLTGSFAAGYWAPNITKYGLRSATHQQVTEVFGKNQLINKAGTVAGPMAEVNHNSLAHMTDEDKLAIATYLKTVTSDDPIDLPTAGSESTLKRGKQVYIHACSICHDEGDMSAPRNGDGSNWYRRLKSSGLSGLYRHSIRGYNSMPVRGACVTCSDGDLIAATEYILHNSLSRSQWEDLATAGEKKYPASGQDVYKENCAVCHDDGKNGAPKLGDKAVWQPLIAKNMDVLLQNTLSSEEHPKNGGCKLCSTGELMEAIKFMVAQSKSEGNYSLW